MKNGVDDFVLVDVRSEKHYAISHVPGAVNIPTARITPHRISQDYAPDTLFVVYCWGPGCNGSTKAAYRLSQMGYAVKEMIGGIEYWEDRERYPIERGTVR
ncbi:MAG: sulfurtransferase [Chloroflexi bacterium]|nr:sulfurtransferase [Chloroflexota bacterium]